jgi:lipopolysaccharide transport system permease protein/teichoic acid transport system permease protein
MIHPNRAMFKSFLSFIFLIMRQKQLIASLARRDVASRYVGSLLGFLWTFIHPLVMIFVFWLVFSVGFRVKPMNDAPFVVWLTAGISIWFVFVDIVNGSAGVVVAHANLIKKTVFPSQILPVVKIVACLITHAVFLVILCGLIFMQGVGFSLYMFQFVYYLAAMTVLALGLAWAVSALNVFIRDVAQIVNVMLQVGFWATPIFWDIQIMPPLVRKAVRFNPMFYVVQGYRDSFIYHTPFWEHLNLTIYFWCIAAACFVIGALIFKRLKPQFADVL